MGKGSNTTTTSATSAPDPQAEQAYRDILARAQGVANTPYQAYTGQLTADVNSQQNAGIAGINNNANFASPYIQQASQQAQQASAPITAQQIQSYLNPYTQNVVDATTAQMQHDNSSQMAQLQGNQISQGALGGNATGVAKGILAGQQGRTMASTTAGLYQQGYGQALSAAQQQQQTGLAGANAQANYGISGQGAALAGAGAQIAAGTLQQQTQQAQLNALYQQYAQAQAYPYQQTQWLAGLGTGVGSNLGGTSNGSTTAPAPNQTAQYAGLGLTAAGMFLNRGGAVHRAMGGGVAGYADGGAPGPMPWGGIAPSWIPNMSIHGGSGAPQAHAPSAPNTPAAAFDPAKLAAGLGGLGNKNLSGQIGQMFNPEAYGNSLGGGSGIYGGSSSAPLPGLDASDYGEGFAHGGGVMGYAGGGSPMLPLDPNDPVAMFGEGEPEIGPGASFNDRIAPTQNAVATGMFDPQGANYNDMAGTPGMVASNAGVVPMPAARPDEAGAPVVAEDEEDDAPPVGVAGRAGGPPQGGGVMSFAQQGPGSYQNMPDAITQPKESFGLGYLSPNAKTGLMAAGLGMLASRSPNLGNAIGDGGIAGLSAYGSAEENDRKVAAEAAKLSREARKEFIENAMNDRKQNETERHNVASEKNAASQRSKYIPAGSVVDGDSVRPLVLDQSTGKIIDAVTGKPPVAGAKIVPPPGKGNNTGPINEDDARAIAQYYVASGDNSRLNGLGVTSAARQAVQKYIREEMETRKVSPEEMATRVAEFAGRKAGQRTLAVQEAKMGSAAIEAEGAIKQARGVIERLPRTSFLPINKLIEGYSNKTLNPDQVELYGRTQAIVNTYAAVMARGANVTTDSSRHHAMELLNTAGDPATYNRMLDTMLNEINMAKHAPAKMREFYRQQYGPQSATPPAADDAGTSGAPAAGGTSKFTPPPGALSRVYTGEDPRFKGRTFYYDPNTKQPYPGQ